MNAEERLDMVLSMIKSMPIKAASSDEEPWVKIGLIELTKIVEVGEGTDHPENWVHEPCKVLRGEYEPLGKPYVFSHSPHHWNDYVEGRDPLRTYHWCNGEIVRELDPMPYIDAGTLVRFPEPAWGRRFKPRTPYDQVEEHYK